MTWNEGAAGKTNSLVPFSPSFAGDYTILAAPEERIALSRGISRIKTGLFPGTIRDVTAPEERTALSRGSSEVNREVPPVQFETLQETALSKEGENNNA